MVLRADFGDGILCVDAKNPTDPPVSIAQTQWTQTWQTELCFPLAMIVHFPACSKMACARAVNLAKTGDDRSSAKS